MQDDDLDGDFAFLFKKLIFVLFQSIVWTVLGF
jgi:hypothetical protein